MVAPLQNPRSHRPSAAMRRAYRLVARALLPEPPPEAPAPPLAAWKAWLFAAWTVAAVAAYLLFLF